MEFTTKYPGSFGEVLQGRVEHRDVLLSCPVNIYTNVKILESTSPKNKFKWEKAAAFLGNILTKWDYKNYIDDLDIDIFSNIPYGKGMASSTADLCGVYYCLLKMFKKEFNQEELIEQCIKIEPTDSIIFNEMTIFDYKKGIYKEKIGPYFKYNILAFEGEKTVDTLEFNNKKLPTLSKVDDLFEVLREAIKEKNLKKLAYVSTESIIRNQKRLYYDWVQYVMNVKDETSGLGIMGAHSGNVLGIIYDDDEKFNYAVEFAKKLSGYKIYPVQTLNRIDI
jgi:L-threonine kinase